MEKTDHIRMLREDLFITPEIIRVNYEFLNESNQDISTEVAFPVPEIGDNLYENSHAFSDFEVTVNGKQKAFQTQSVARLNGKDVTHLLEKYDLPLDRFVDANQVSADKLAKLKAQGLYNTTVLDGILLPAYELALTYHWKQEFPAHQLVKISHEYRPVLGENSSGLLIFPEKWQSLKADKFISGQHKASHLGYILSTGSNWKNGIENFHLKICGDLFFFYEIDGKPASGQGCTDITRRNYKPQQELLVEFVQEKRN